jgi:hypothetical protein
MLLQKGIDGFIQDRLLEWGLNISTAAEYNQELARLGSIDGSFSTIDLTSASDCVSLALGHRLPAPLQGWVFQTRTPVTHYRGRKIELGMVSMMGNGFTFSLQTAIFASVVKAAYDLEGLPFRTGRSRNWGVFGDDIIVMARAFTKVSRLLALLGFELNGDKSFSVGYFRESCGADWFKGYPVRGVYLRRLRTDADRYSAINRLNRWSARHGVPLACTIEALSHGLRSNFRVPPSAADTAGLKVPFVLSPPRTVTDHYWHPYKGLADRLPTVRFESDDDGNVSPSIAVALFGGYLRGNERSFSLSDFCGPLRPVELTRYGYICSPRRKPDDVRHFKIVRESLPWWDFMPRDLYQGISYGSWKAAVAGNLLAEERG